MGKLAVHMRIANIQVTNEDVDTRGLAIDDLVGIWRKLRAPREILIKAAQIANTLGGDGTPEPVLGLEVETVVQNHASAYLCSERPLEIGICAGVAMMKLLSGEPEISGWTAPDIFAVALWSALEFQSPLSEAKREALRQEVLNLAMNRALAAGEASRIRSEVVDFVDLTVTQGDDGKLTNNFKKITAGTINALRRNAALDREELDFLWWIQSGRSRILNRPLNRIDDPVRLVATGVEAADLLRRLPAQVHRELVLRTLDEDPSLNLEALIAALGDDRETIANHAQSDNIDLAPPVFPLLHGLRAGSSTLDGASLCRSSGDWGARALLEASLARLSVTGNGVL